LPSGAGGGGCGRCGRVDTPGQACHPVCIRWRRAAAPCSVRPGAAAAAVGGAAPRMANRVGRPTVPNTSLTCAVGHRPRTPGTAGRRCWPLLAGRGQAQQSRTAFDNSGRCWVDLPE
jgi:hypothetical protein